MAESFSILHSTGLLTAHTSTELLQQLNQCLNAGVKIAVVDLQNIEFIDSSGLGILVSMHNRLKLAGGKLYLCAPKPQATSLFDISDLGRLFEIVPTWEDFNNTVVENNQAVLVQS